MKINIGNTDCLLRLLVAAWFAFLFFNGIATGALGLMLVIFGAFFTVTSLVGFCPLYAVFGLNTFSNKI